MTLGEIHDVLGQVSYRDWCFHIGEDRGAVWLQVRFKADDTETGDRRTEHGRKWLLSQHMTKGEIVQTAFKAVLTAEEHEAREHFLYRERAVFGPHINVDELLSVCDRLERRNG